MKKMIKAVIFDIDGTLLDSKNFILESFRHTCLTCRLPIIDEAMVNSCGGASLRETYARYYSGEDLERLCQVHRDFQEENFHLCTAFSDTRRTLGTLAKSGMSQGVITSRGETAHVTLRNNNIDGFFDKIVTNQDVRRGKPDPEGMLLVLEHFNLKPTDVLMVGDMEADILIGKNTGVRTVGVSCGFSTPEMLKSFGADYIVPNVGGVLPIVDSLRKNRPSAFA